MKKSIALLIAVLCLSGFSQVLGQKKLNKWEGALLVQGFELNLIFKFNEETCLIDVPAQGVVDYPASEFKIANDSVYMSFTGLFQAQFVGENQSDTLIAGNWLQSG